jgi:hypothetical protein
MEEAKSAFFTNGTWEIVPTHHTWNLLSFKWVFKIKVDEHGVITRYHARLVAKGFLQREGVDYRDIFSPVVRYPLWPIQAAPRLPQSVHPGRPGHPLLHGMSIAPGFCLKLLKSVYGLKQARRLFHELLVYFLLTLGFVANPNDTCVMYLGTGRFIALLAIYVDDLLLFTTTTELGDEIAAKLNAKFNCVDLGQITWCLGMRITTSADRHTITLDDLDQYLTTIVARYEFEGLQSVPTPMIHDLNQGGLPHHG